MENGSELATVTNRELHEAMMTLTGIRRRERMRDTFLILVIFAGSFVASAFLCSLLLPKYLETVAGLRTEGDTICFNPRHTFNGIQEWAPRSMKDGEPAEWGIKVRPDTPAAVETIWRDRDGNNEIDWMEVTLSLGGDLRARIEFDPTDVFGAVEVSCSTRDTTLVHRDINGDGTFDMLLERSVKDGEERLVRVSVPFYAADHEVLLERPFDEDECTIILPNNELKELVFEEGLW